MQTFVFLLAAVSCTIAFVLISGYIPLTENDLSEFFTGKRRSNSMCNISTLLLDERTVGKPSSQNSAIQALTDRKAVKASSSQRWIFMITPTYRRVTQRLDLVRLFNTLGHIQNLHLIVVEDRQKRSWKVSELFNMRLIKHWSHSAVKSTRGLQACTLHLQLYIFFQKFLQDMSAARCLA
jgi:hypothetical protein